MNIMSSLGGLVSVGKAFVAANRPEILFGTSVVSTLGAVVMAARGGYKSGIQVADAEVQSVLMKLEADAVTAYESEVAKPEHKLCSKEIAKLTWLNYLPAAGATLGAVGSTTGLHLVHVHEKKQLAAAALLAVEQVRKEGVELKKEITEGLGITTTEDPKELEKAAKKSANVRVVQSDGEIEDLYLVRDAHTQRDVWSNRGRIEDAIMDINIMLSTDDSVELNDFYTRAGFGSVPDGTSLGWQARQLVGLDWDTSVRDDGRPVRQFRLDPSPKEIRKPGA